MLELPTDRRADAIDTMPTRPRSLPGPTVLGWPETLLVPRDPEGSRQQPVEQLESGVRALLARGLGALGGAALSARLSLAGLSAHGGEGVFESRVEGLLVGWPSDAAAGEVARLQQACGDGPAVEAESRGEAVDIGDLAGDARWPSVSGAALDSGYRSVLVVPVLDASGVIGSLSHWSLERRESPSPQQVAKLDAVAAHLTILLANVGSVAATNRTIAQLRDAMVSRSVIEQAKGVLMAREKIDAETAWEYLVRISQRTHRKLRDISADIVGKASSGSFS